MKVKKILTQIIIVALLAASFTGCSGKSADSVTDSKESPTYNLRLSTSASAEDPLTLSAQRYADAVREATNGDVEITVYTSSQLGDTISVYAELMMGSVDMAWQTIPDTYDKRANVGMMPYIVSNWDDVTELYSNKDLWFLKALAEVNAEQGVTLLG